MPSYTNTATWDFTPARELLESLADKGRAIQDDHSPAQFKSRPPPSDLEFSADHGGVGLGNFNKVWDYLGVERVSPKPTVPTFELSLSQSRRENDYASDSALYYPTPSKNVKWKDETDGGELTEVQEAPNDSGLTKNQRKKRNRKLRKAAEQGSASLGDKVPAERVDENSADESEDATQFFSTPTKQSQATTHESSPLTNVVTRSQARAAAENSSPADVSLTHRSLLPHNIAPRQSAGRAAAPAQVSTTKSEKPATSGGDASKAPINLSIYNSDTQLSTPTKIAPKSVRSDQAPTLSLYDPATQVSKALQGQAPDLPKKNTGQSLLSFSDNDKIPEAVEKVAAAANKFTTPVKSTASTSTLHGSLIKPAKAPFLPRQKSEPPQQQSRSTYAQSGISTLKPDLPHPVIQGARPIPRPKNSNGQATSGPYGSSLPSPGISGDTSRQYIVPLTTRTKADRNWDLLQKLMQRFPQDRESLTSPLQLSYNHPVPHGIHVFVDASNILIGFMEHLKRARNIPSNARVTRVLPQFHALALLLERRRPIAKRVLAGSTPWVDAFDEAKQVGYDCSILDKVWKARELTQRQKRFAARAAGQSGASASDSNEEFSDSIPHAQQPKWVEQGVDEILHLKILESIIDTPAQQHALDKAKVESGPGGKAAGVVVPGGPTMVLATGDAAEAEYSSGFRKMVERALSHGWHVEVMAWGSSVSYDWKKLEKKKDYAGRFKIIELDDFAEELFGAD